MDAPKKVVLKRRRSELPPDTLIVEKKHRSNGDRRIAPATRYIRHKASKATIRTTTTNHENTESSQQTSRPTNERREFHLSQPAATPTPVAGINKKKRKQDDDRVATVVEKRSKLHDNQTSAISQGVQVDHEPQPLPKPLKRPGHGTAKAVARQNNATQPKPTTFVEGQIALEQQRLDALAEEMHKFALDEIAKTPKPEIKSRPKMSAAQARARHQALRPSTPEPKTTSQTDEMDTSPDSEYVFDTYILAPQTPEHTIEGNAQVVHTSDQAGNVGYLVITEDEEKLWEEFIERDELEDSEPEDEDDENGKILSRQCSPALIALHSPLTHPSAEAYYGADYPSDELASDDEYDRGAYGYRQQHGSDDEQYDADTWSDEEDKRLMNPFGAKGKVSAQFAKYLNRDSKGTADGDESGDEA